MLEATRDSLSLIGTQNKTDRTKLLLALLRHLQAALLFYTILPLPHGVDLRWRGIALWAPLVGVILAGLLAIVDGCLEIVLPAASLLRSAIVVVLWLVLTGGLHLDGAMDTADGLAVIDREKRLTVMADSRSGAFGVMAAVVILLLKTVALTEITNHRFSYLLHVLAWGRWGQLYAITHYVYLKAEGKGKFHQGGIDRWQVYGIGLILLGCVFLAWDLRFFVPLCGLLAWLVGYWFDRQLGGQTGDTYGAIVEWTESIGLVLAALLFRSQITFH